MNTILRTSVNNDGSTFKQNNKKVSAPISAGRLFSRKHDNKKRQDLEKLRKQKRYSRPANMAVYGEKDDLFEEMS